jgi:tRNA(fMet)-specific endonuclease VapC
VVCGEIYEGLEGFAGVRTRLTQFAEFLETIKVYGLDLSVARAYASLRSELRSQGRLIPDNDIWIAATAIVHGLTVVSRDRHFQRIPQLRLYPGT